MQADDVITRVEKRIAMVTHLPEDNGEGLQILHYEAGQARCRKSPSLVKAEQRMRLQSLKMPDSQSPRRSEQHAAVHLSCSACKPDCPWSHRGGAPEDLAPKRRRELGCA